MTGRIHFASSKKLGYDRPSLHSEMLLWRLVLITASHTIYDMECAALKQHLISAVVHG